MTPPYLSEKCLYVLELVRIDVRYFEVFTGH